MSLPILVVDDSLTVRMGLAEMLEAAGLSVTACATGAEARAALADGQFSLAILDVLLPDADGIELLKEIRGTASAAETAVMLLSTEAEVRDRVRGLRTGADEYIGKPYDPNHVVARALELAGRLAPSAPTTETVLLIDDSATFREALKATLEEAGYHVAAAASGEEGLGLAAFVRPAAVVVDGVLPGIDGPTVIRRIRFDAALRRVPCLLLTASEEEDAELRALEAGADAFVRKDHDTAVILAKFKAMLRSAGAQAGGEIAQSLLGPKKILAVEGSESHLERTAAAVRACGYDVALARSGEEALELLAVQPVDCILLDARMPGIGGLETCRRLKDIPVMRETPVIMLGDAGDADSLLEALGAGADDFISKASEVEVLQARVAAQLRRKLFEEESRLHRAQQLQRELEAAETRAAKEIAEVRAALVEELEMKNKELDSFAYSVAHDLRAPLRSIDGFSQALLEDYTEKLDDQGRQYLGYVRESAQQMAELIDNLLSLSRITRSEVQRESIDLGALARKIGSRLEQRDPDRKVALVVADGLTAQADGHLMTIVFENLLGNAWKFTRDRAEARVEVGAATSEGQTAFFVRDNGAGFDMAYSSKLFGVFQRLHSAKEFEGTGIGLATVQRVIRRHGGRIWAEGEVDRGAAFFFTLPNGAGGPGALAHG